MAETYASIVAGCSALLEDYDGQLWTPSVLLRHINLALEDVRLDLTAAGFTRFRKEAPVMTLTTGTTDIGDGTTPPLPADFSAPIKLLERPLGSTQVTEWLPVTPVDDLSADVEPGERLIVYSYQDGKLKTRGATRDLELKLDYWADIADFTGASEAIPIKFTLAPLVFLTCSHVVRAVDRDASDRFRRDAERALSRVRATEAKRKQGEIASMAARYPRGRRLRFSPLIQ